MIQASAFADVFVPAADVSFAAAVLACLALALRGAPVAPWGRLRILVLAAAGAAVWYGTVSWLAARGVFAAGPGVRFPVLPVAVFLPVLLGLALLTRSAFVARLLDATPLSRLIGVQVLRVAGLVFLVEWAWGGLPGEFALPAGIGDIAVGLLAVPVARLVARQSPLAAVAAIWWTALGLLDFAVALGTGFLSSPGPFQMLALDAPNRLVTAYPLALIPTFGVPIFLLLHALTIWKMRRDAGRSVSPALSAHPA
jgi:hypothetical protein